MQERNDIELLREYVRGNSETAFETLVARHVNLVYSVALRKTGNAHAAEEITQAVFIILAKKARGLSPRTILAGWLCETARLTAANFLRGEIRRQRREQEAYMQSVLNEPEPEVWPQIAPLLDDALSRLNQKDRSAVVLRFLENRSLNEVGHALGASEDAAKMRVNRALEKLRKLFTKRGVTFSAVAIAGAVAANSVQAAPLGLAVTVTAAAAKGAVVSGSTLTLIKGALKVMAWTKMKTAAVTGAVILLAAGTTAVVVKTVQRTRAPDIQEMTFARADFAANDFAGVGLLLRFDDPTQTLRIMNIVPNSPAAEAGLSADFIVQKIDGVSVRGKKLKECVNLIRGTAGTKVRLELVSPDQKKTQSVELTRQKLQLEPVQLRIRDKP